MAVKRLTIGGNDIQVAEADKATKDASGNTITTTYATKTALTTAVPNTTTAGQLLTSTATAGTATWAAPAAWVYIGSTEASATNSTALLWVDTGTFAGYAVLKYRVDTVSGGTTSTSWILVNATYGAAS